MRQLSHCHRKTYPCTWLTRLGLYLAIAFTFSPLTPAALSADEDDDSAQVSHIQVQEFEPTPQKISRVLAQALVRSLRTPPADSSPVGFILPELAKQGIDKKTFDAFEDQVLAMYQNMALSFISNSYVRTYFGVAEEEAGWLRLYYNFEDLLLNEGEGLKYWRSAVAYDKYLIHKDRIDYYKNNLTQKSISEMARELGIHEDTIRSELWKFNISIYAIWKQYKIADGLNLYDAARRRAEAGESLESIAKDLHIGFAALTDILHYVRVQDKGAPWTPLEIHLLKICFADFDISDLTWVLKRSEGAIYAQARELGLTQKGITPRRLIIPGMGLPSYQTLEQNAEILEQFLIGTLYEDAAALAAILNVNPSTLQKWRRRYDLIPISASQEQARQAKRTKHRQEQTPEQLTRDQQQREMIDREIELFRKDGTIITTSNATTKLNVTWERYVGSSSYAPGRRLAHLAIFSSNYHRLIALHTRLKKLRDLAPKGLSIWLFISRPPAIDADAATQQAYAQVLRCLDELRLKKQAELLALAVTWIGEGKLGQQNQRGPTAELGNAFGVPSQAITSTGGYGAGNGGHAKRFFDSTEAFYSALQNAVATALLQETNEVVKERFRRFKIEQVFRVIKDLTSQELVDKEIELFRQDGTIITDSNATAKLNVTWSKYVGSGSYAPDHPQAHLAIFPSKYHRLIALHARLKELGHLAPMGLSIRSFKLDPPVATADAATQQAYAQVLRCLDEARLTKQAELLALALTWIGEGKLGQQNQGGALTELANAFGVPSQAIVATGELYAEGRASYTKRFFNSPDAFYAALQNAVAAALVNQADAKVRERLSSFRVDQVFRVERSRRAARSPSTSTGLNRKPQLGPCQDLRQAADDALIEPRDTDSSEP